MQQALHGRPLNQQKPPSSRMTQQRSVTCRFSQRSFFKIRALCSQNEERFGLPQEVYEVIVQHGWEKFVSHPDEKNLKKKSINVTLIKEF
ncbi:hypothetical protein V6N13_091035 [Hibiscus sabdariffa]